jgi:hypothetical protein
MSVGEIGRGNGELEVLRGIEASENHSNIS